MGAWGASAFDNDTANDWAYGLEKVADLSVVETAVDEVINIGDDYLDADYACELLAACEVMARLRGRPGYLNAYTEKIDAWVSAHPQPVPPELIDKASTAIDRILTEPSELMELWGEGDDTEWREAVDDLRRRLAG